MVSECPVERLRELAPLIRNFLEVSRFLGNLDEDLAARNWEYFIKQGIGVVFIIEDDGGIVGFLAAMKYHDFLTGDLKAQEVGWYVDERHRGKGLQLLIKYMEWAKESGCKFAFMSYMEDSMPDVVKSIYERLGFKLVEILYGKEI